MCGGVPAATGIPGTGEGPVGKAPLPKGGEGGTAGAWPPQEEQEAQDIAARVLLKSPQLKMSQPLFLHPDHFTCTMRAFVGRGPAQPRRS